MEKERKKRKNLVDPEHKDGRGGRTTLQGEGHSGGRGGRDDWSYVRTRR